MKTTVLQSRPEPQECEIQKAAYFLWQELGRPAGRELETWFAAKERLRHQPARPPSGYARHGDRSPESISANN